MPIFITLYLVIMKITYCPYKKILTYMFLCSAASYMRWEKKTKKNTQFTVLQSCVLKCFHAVGFRQRLRLQVIHPSHFCFCTTGVLHEVWLCQLGAGPFSCSKGCPFGSNRQFWRADTGRRHSNRSTCCQMIYSFPPGERSWQEEEGVSLHQICSVRGKKGERSSSYDSWHRTQAVW